MRRITQLEIQSLLNSYASGGYSMKEIPEYFELHNSRISQIIKAKGKT